MDSWAKLEIGVVMTVLGMGIVFVVLVFLAVVLKLMEKVCAPRTATARIAAPPKEPALPAPPVAPAHREDPALPAVIAAAIAVFTGAAAPPLIRSIRKAGEELPAWGRMGRQEQIASRKIR
jgi:glutaconyl-CoA/methylmalonyl-CoA decarboxylase subunit delta